MCSIEFLFVRKYIGKIICNANYNYVFIALYIVHCSVNLC